MAPGNPLEDQARDPLTDQHVLYQLAADHPELRPLIAGNPNTYPALLDWLADLEDPKIDAALAARASEGAESSLEAEETELLEPSTPPPSPPAYQPAVPGPIVQRNPVMPRDRANDVPIFPAPQPQYVAPAFPIPAEALPVSAAEPPRRNGALIAAFVGLGLLAVVAAGIAVYIFLGGGGTPQAGSESSPAASSAAPAQSDSPQSTSPTPTPDVQYPAPAGAASFTWFSSPSGNIACQLGDDKAECTIFENNYKASGYPDCGTGAVNLTIDQSGAKIACSAEPIDGASDILVYSASAAHGDFACTSSESGMSCWNTITGASFALARDGWTTSNTGPIPDGKRPWVSN